MALQALCKATWQFRYKRRNPKHSLYMPTVATLKDIWVTENGHINDASLVKIGLTDMLLWKYATLFQQFLMIANR